MKHSTLALSLCVLGLAACGGGGNESGPPDDILVSPARIAVKGIGTGCANGTGPTVFIHGGVPPYKLFNTLPQGIRLDKSVLMQSGDSFVVTLTGQCFEAMTIRIEDALGRLAEVDVTNQPASTF
jgi:hypothetical protein